jgi:exopolyphosphatase/guanosine-5'-triphosphate,3'-diphosphate pyrophosphatase
MSNQPTEPASPAVVPRWEWRTFGELDDANELLASVRTFPAMESDETYLVSLHGDASVKVRAGLLDVKALQRVNGAGLQLWTPRMKAAFPLDEEAVTTAFDVLGVPLPTALHAPVGHEELMDLVDEAPDVRVVGVHKRRHRCVIDECMVEDTDVTVGGLTTRTVAVESPDPGLVSETARRLGLEGRPNTCVARGLRSLLDWRPGRFAVVDVGTNSVKFIVGHRREDDGPGVEIDTAVVTRLGEGLEEAGELAPDAVRRTVDAIAGLVEDARRDGPITVVAVGTAGLRQAPNRDAFLDELLTRSDVAAEVISGSEEARLAYVAAVSTLRPTGDRLLVFDSGGGSTQFTFGSRDQIEDQFSIDVGAVRITERFGLAQAVPRDTVRDALTAIATQLDRVRGRSRPDMVIAIGGTSTNLAAVRHGLAAYDADTVHGTVVDVAEVERQIELFRRLPADERRAVAGLQPARAEVILAGACIVRTILTLTGQDAVTVSDRGLRHGVLAERFPG